MQQIRNKLEEEILELIEIRKTLEPGSKEFSNLESALEANIRKYVDIYRAEDEVEDKVQNRTFKYEQFEFEKVKFQKEMEFKEKELEFKEKQLNAEKEQRLADLKARIELEKRKIDLEQHKIEIEQNRYDLECDKFEVEKPKSKIRLIVDIAGVIVGFAVPALGFVAYERGLNHIRVIEQTGSLNGYAESRMLPSPWKNMTTRLAR